MHQFDVVILGAGPAGAITALTLKKSYPRLTVAMVEACDAPVIRPGEILTEEALPILQQLDLLDFFKEQRHTPLSSKAHAASKSKDSAKAFGAPEIGIGWYLDRARFDSMLSGYAAASGAFFIRATMTDVQFKASGEWQLTIRSASNCTTLTAKFVVDATGRNARFASEIGVAQLTYDTMIGIVRVINLEDAERFTDLDPLIEPFEHGWWYSALTSNRQLAIVAMTDADIGKRLQLTHIDQWIEHLSQSPRTYERAAGLKMRGDLLVRAANTRALHSCCGESWLAAGDAAYSMDPLLMNGILCALRFGNHAAKAIAEHFLGKQTGLLDYQEMVQSEFEKNLKLRAEIYRSEGSWKNAQFWTRRQTVPALPDNRQVRKPTLSISSKAAVGGTPQAKRVVAVRTQ